MIIIPQELPPFSHFDGVVVLMPPSKWNPLQEDQEFKASLSYMARFYLRTNQYVSIWVQLGVCSTNLLKRLRPEDHLSPELQGCLGQHSKTLHQKKERGRKKERERERKKEDR
jgi:hypothetical protein